MTKSQRRSQTFKKGDIVSPFSDVIRSNDNNLQKLIKAVVVSTYKINYETSYKQQVTLKIIEGSVPYTNKSEKFVVYSNSIQLCRDTGHYEIY